MASRLNIAQKLATLLTIENEIFFKTVDPTRVRWKDIFLRKIDSHFVRIYLFSKKSQLVEYSVQMRFFDPPIMHFSFKMNIILSITIGLRFFLPPNQ